MRFFNVAVAVFVMVGACATLEPIRGARMPSVAQADEAAVLEGAMEVLIEDLDQGGRIRYFLISGKQRVPLQFMTPPQNLTTGTRVRVRGQWAEDGTLIVTTLERI